MEETAYNSVVKDLKNHEGHPEGILPLGCAPPFAEHVPGVRQEKVRAGGCAALIGFLLPTGFI